jgi:MFS family permease
MASLASSAILFQVLFIHPALWLGMRLTTGFCLAGTSVVVESWLNARSDNQSRGRVLSLYMLVAYFSMAGGQWLLKSSNPAGFHLFIFASILLSLALIPMLISRTEAPPIETHQGIGIKALFHESSTGTLTIFISAMATGAMFGMGPVYAARANFDLSQTALFMSTFILLGAIAQWPMGWLSDHYDRRLVILVSGLAAGLSSLVLMFYLENLPLWLFFCLWGLLGALTLPMYSIGVAHTNDRLLPSQMIGASSTIILLYGAGSVIGPLLTGYLLEHVGLAGFFLMITIVHLTIAVGVGYFMQQTPPVAEEDSTLFQAVPPRPTTVVMEAVAHEAEESQASESP